MTNAFSGLEELCWCDVMLEADPNPARVQGGKKDGWGSFFQLQVRPRPGYIRTATDARSGAL